MRQSILLLLLTLLLTACTAGAQSSEFETPQIAHGAEIYATYCAVCHGVDLEGQADWQIPNPDGTWRSPPHDETGHTWHHPDSYLYERIRTGTQLLDAQMQAASNMPAYGNILSDSEIEAVVLFIKSRWPDDIRAIQESRN